MRPPSSRLGNSQVAVQVAVWRQSCRGRVEVVGSVGVLYCVVVVVVVVGVRLGGSRCMVVGVVVVVVVGVVVIVVVVRW